MDPAESIFSMLDYSIDPLSQEEALDMNLGLDDILSNDFNFLPSDDNLISDIFNDDLLSSLDLPDALCGSDVFQTLNNTKNYAARHGKTKITLNAAKSSQQTFHKSLSILNNSCVNKHGRVTISVGAPKVYISPATKKSTGAAGTSILVKSKKAKRRSLLQNKEPPKCADIFNAYTDSYSYAFFPALRDHDYCVKLKDDTYTKKECPSFNSQQVQNELQDLLHDYIPDDVVLNELPNCLQDLMSLDTSYMLNSDDLLHGLNDACNLMTDHYIEDLEQQLFDFGPGLSLPNLDITDDDLNVVTQSSAQTNVGDESAVKDIEVDIVYSPFAESRSDSFDCASSTTGCTEESSSEDTDCRSSSPKSKRHRSLSGSSSLTSRRKRRFSSRSSLNSSDSMSDTSSLDDSAPSSRSSSPDRSLTLLGFSPFASHNSVFSNKNNHSKYHAVKTNRHRKHVTWTNKFSSKYMKPTLVKKKKTKVIDLSHRNFNVASHKGLARIDASASHQVNCSGEINEKVLYIGDIPNGTKRSDLSSWFGKYGTIEDIQTYFNGNGSNYAFITFKYSHETRNAIKYGNDDLRHSKFTLSYGKRRNNSYKDLDLFTESSLDFRIDTDKDVLDFDSLLRSTTVESHKLKKYS